MFSPTIMNVSTHGKKALSKNNKLKALLVLSYCCMLEFTIAVRAADLHIELNCIPVRVAVPH